MNIPLCDFPGPVYLLISENVPSLVYYSHVPALIMAFLLGVCVFLYGRNNVIKRTFLFILSVFILWAFFSLTTWAANRSDIIMFIWSVIILIEPLLHIGSLYLLHLIYNKTDVTFKTKLYWCILYVPLILIAPTPSLLRGFDTGICFPAEGIASHYSYLLEIFFIVLIVIFSIKKYQLSTHPYQKKKILLLSMGVIISLSIFTIGNMIGSFLGEWNVAQISLFSIHILAGFLAYLIVKYKIFNIQLGSTEIIVGSISIMVFALVLVRNLFVYQRILIFITFLFCLILGYFLTQSVKREIDLREKLKRQAEELRIANKKLKEVDEIKSEFISLATHHLGTPLTAIKGYVSLLQEPNNNIFQRNTTLATIQRHTTNLVNIVRDFLDVYKIEQQEMKYYFEDINLMDIIDEIVNECREVIEAKNNNFNYIVDEKGNFNIRGDAEKVRRAILNILENSAKYTSDGTIEISLASYQEKINITISDTGERNSPQVPTRLIEKFTQSGNREEANVIAQGLGIYVAKQIVEAHQGKLRIEFKEGVGGLIFTLELPI